MEQPYDYLIEKKILRKILGTFGVSLPQKLNRDHNPWQQKPLMDQYLALGGPQSPLTSILGGILQNLGASQESKEELCGLIFDATKLQTIEDMDLVHEFFHSKLLKVKRCGRIIILCREPRYENSAKGYAIMKSLEAFTKSLAREIGKRGSTIQLITLKPLILEDEDLAKTCLQGVLHFFLSRHSSFITGQVVRLDTNKKASLVLEQPLAGKIALVTGSARGIGEATARVLAREGAQVVVLDRPNDKDLAIKVAKEIGGKTLLLDITDDKAGEEIANYFAEGVDIIVHNAGITRDKTLAFMDLTKWQQVLQVNLGAIFKINDKVLPLIREGGRIICMSSISGFAGNYGQCNYAATKAALIGYVAGLAQEMEDRNITANAIAPGFIETRMVKTMPFATKEGGRRISSLKQGGWPQDIAEAIAFLCSSGANSINGQTLRVCGGSFFGG